MLRSLESTAENGDREMFAQLKRFLHWVGVCFLSRDNFFLTRGRFFSDGSENFVFPADFISRLLDSER